MDTSQSAGNDESDSYSLIGFDESAASSLQKFDDFAELSSGYFFELDHDLKYQYLSAQFPEVTGIPRRMVLGMSDAEIAWVDDISEPKPEYIEALHSRRSFSKKNFAFLHPDGRVVCLSVSGKVIRGKGGVFSGFRCLAVETEPAIAAGHGDRDTQAVYRLAGRIANIGFWEWDEIKDNCAYCSEELARLHGVTVEEFLSQSSTDVKNRRWIHPSDRARYDRAVEAYTNEPLGYEIEYRILREQGKSIHVLEVVVPITDESNALVRSFGFVKDITTQKRAAQALDRRHDDLDTRVRQRTVELEQINEELTRSKSQLREATRIAKLGYFRWDSINERCLYRDEELSVILGTGPSDCRNETTSDFLARVHPDDVKRVTSTYSACRENPMPVNIEYRLVQPSGEIRYVAERSTPDFDADGKVTGTFGTMQDITERKRIEDELARVEERLSELGDNAREVLYVLSADWRDVIYVSRAFEDIWGRSCESLIADPRIWYEDLHPDDRDMIYSEIARKMSGDDPSPHFSDARIIGKSGDIRWLSARVYPIRDENGTTIRFAGVAEDITERKVATDSLHHAQKLEAVGQLTGGVAHDFNNLLAVILGNTQLLLEQCDSEDAALLDDVLAAGRRGAKLTTRLLAFSRLQPLRPTWVDLNELISSMGELLRRTLGTLITVQIDLRGEDVRVYVDAGLLENAVLNLALNSRDAMVDGGLLHIVVDKQELDGVNPTAVISVKDDGTGMSASDLSRAMEPFFTTKNLGEGAGLGLSMVYGFVKQSDGDLTIESRPGEGTVAEIFLPCGCE